MLGFTVGVIIGALLGALGAALAIAKVIGDERPIDHGIPTIPRRRA